MTLTVAKEINANPIYLGPTYAVSLIAPGNKMRVEIKGDVELLSQMVCQSMLQDPQAALIVINACGMYAHAKDESRDAINKLLHRT